MATKAGVWIDHKQAIAVLITDAGHEVKKIAFSIGQPCRSSGRAKSKQSYTPNDFVAEDKIERKVENDRKDYYDDVIASIRGASAILILGPGEAKGEFAKRIKSKKIRGLKVEVETTEKMTDRQVSAKVKAHFAKVPAGKTVAPTNAAKKTTATATSGKRSKKAGLK